MLRTFLLPIHEPFLFSIQIVTFFRLNLKKTNSESKFARISFTTSHKYTLYLKFLIVILNYDYYLYNNYIFTNIFKK